MEVTTVTVSHSRKINHALYSGEQYESSDHFVSISAEVETGEDVVAAHRELMLMCKELTNTSVADEILKLQGGMAWDAFLETMKAYRLGKPISEEQHNKMTRLQKSIYHELQLLVRSKHEQKDKKEVGGGTA